ncbi:hypothetical protein [Pseudovibrio ascidiaceicola]|uniref:hypothetical protein n=1 Tax=Pseudovibrio ascidiaceicola TaxID=285279 RepID=UPI000D68D75C|nr:hypothetical protein [Pseudovibrio ascidiaceicola]
MKLKFSSFSQQSSKATASWCCIIACFLLLASCVRDDPRYPAYYRYAVDVKVDGQPVRIERVIKCTGTLVSGGTNAPGVTTGGTYANPPIMGAYVPGTKQAVYTRVTPACRWASATQEEREADRRKNYRSLDTAFTKQHRTLQPNSILPVLWVNNDETLDQIEYYVSKRALSGQHSHVEFVKAHPPEITDETAFLASEERAETESPDLTPFLFPRDQNKADEFQLYKDRFGGPEHGFRIVSICHGAWRIPRAEWSLVPGMTEWVASLPKDSVGYKLPSDLWLKFQDFVPGGGARNSFSLTPINRISEREREFSGRFATLDAIHPVIPTEQGAYVDLNRAGFFACNYDVLHPNREPRWGGEGYMRDFSPNGGFVVRFEDHKLWAMFAPNTPVFVPLLDDFFVFREASLGGRSIDEPVVKGWKE